MIPERNTLNPIQFFLSIIFLFIIFSIYLSLRPILADLHAYVFLANLRAITEGSVFFGYEEPMSILFLYFWKTLFGLNYLTAFQTLSALLFSLCLHLIMLLFRKGDWKLNHYFLVYFSAYLPYSHEFPTVYFNELLGTLFILLLFHTFRLETILDLLLLPVLIIITFMADLRFFLLGFTIFVVIQSLIGMGKMKSRTTVFYKRKNIPLIVLLSYLGMVILFLVFSSITDFFGESSFFGLVGYWFRVVVYILPAFLLLFVGNILLGTEKELRTMAFTVILVISIFGIILLNYSRYNPNLQKDIEIQKNELVRIQPQILGLGNIYVDPILSNYLYFQTKLVTQHFQSKTKTNTDLLYVSDIWQADINEIEKKYLTRRRRQRQELYPVGQNAALILPSLEANILKDEDNHRLTSKIKEARQNIPQLTRYNRYLRWQIKFINYSSLQD